MDRELSKILPFFIHIVFLIFAAGATAMGPGDVPAAASPGMGDSPDDFKKPPEPAPPEVSPVAKKAIEDAKMAATEVDRRATRELPAIDTAVREVGTKIKETGVAGLGGRDLRGARAEVVGNARNLSEGLRSVRDQKKALEKSKSTLDKEVRSATKKYGDLGCEYIGVPTKECDKAEAELTALHEASDEIKEGIADAADIEREYKDNAKKLGEVGSAIDAGMRARGMDPTKDPDDASAGPPEAPARGPKSAKSPSPASGGPDAGGAEKPGKGNETGGGPKDQAQKKSDGGQQGGGQQGGQQGAQSGGANPMADMMKNLAQLAGLQPPPVPAAQPAPPPQPMDPKAAMCASNPRAPDCAQAATPPEKPEALKQPDPPGKKPSDTAGALPAVAGPKGDLNLDAGKFPRADSTPPLAGSRGGGAGVGSGMGGNSRGNAGNNAGSAYGGPATAPVSVNSGNYGGGGGFGAGSSSSSSRNGDSSRRESLVRRGSLNSSRYARAMHDSLLERYRRGPSGISPATRVGSAEVTGPKADNFKKMRYRFQNLMGTLRD